MITEGMLLFLSILIGFSLGVSVVFILILAKRRNTRKDKSHPQKMKRSVGKIKQYIKAHKRCSKPKKDHTSNGKDLLQSKIREKDSSFVEFNCAAEGVDTAEYIRERQSHEDTAYNVLKEKTKK